MIGLSGPAGSGKSEAAQYLIAAHGFTRVKFAGALKTMLMGHFLCCGLTADEAFRRIEGDLKEEPCEFLNGRTPRHAMETLGTEWGRDCLGDDFWINTWKRAVDRVAGPVVVDDCRFDNEAEAINRAGGVVIKLEPKIKRRKKSSHVAEAGVSKSNVAYVVVNDGTIQDLQDRIADILFPTHVTTFGELGVALEK